MAWSRKLRKTLWWAAGLVAVLAIGISAFFIYYHPPMRLMPAPLIFQNAGARLTDRAPDLIEGSQSRSSTRPTVSRWGRATTAFIRWRRTRGCILARPI